MTAHPSTVHTHNHWDTYNLPPLARAAFEAAKAADRAGTELSEAWWHCLSKGQCTEAQFSNALQSARCAWAKVEEFVTLYMREANMESKGATENVGYADGE